ncbi:MAG: type IV pilin protein [Methylophilaceae bacterium]
MKNNPTKNGFTLIELMISVAIIGILASIAYPSYQQSILRSRRADAQGALLGLANAMERYFTENNTFLGASGTAVAPANIGPPRVFAQQSPTGGGIAYYGLTIQAATANTYTLLAAPIGPQAGDNCGNLQITQTGAKLPAPPCW